MIPLPYDPALLREHAYYDTKIKSLVLPPPLKGIDAKKFYSVTEKGLGYFNYIFANDDDDDQSTTNNNNNKNNININTNTKNKRSKHFIDDDQIIENTYNNPYYTKPDDKKTQNDQNVQNNNQLVDDNGNNNTFNINLNLFSTLILNFILFSLLLLSIYSLSKNLYLLFIKTNIKSINKKNHINKLKLKKNDDEIIDVIDNTDNIDNIANINNIENAENNLNQISKLTKKLIQSPLILSNNSNNLNNDTETFNFNKINDNINDTINTNINKRFFNSIDLMDAIEYGYNPNLNNDIDNSNNNNNNNNNNNINNINSFETPRHSYNSSLGSTDINNVPPLTPASISNSPILQSPSQFFNSSQNNFPFSISIPMLNSNIINHNNNASMNKLKKNIYNINNNQNTNIFHPRQQSSIDQFYLPFIPEDSVQNISNISGNQIRNNPILPI
ncbi:uncharacterized protein ASCRUDRAFT_83047 [Ascoidea rubescens DSM 1968]|uniref:Uncharacterized protein n=1 Tax=Ascoidea rubescens DSM 1968 TaxID=1344418 RepID=A0A1D2V8T5_9ASCO|nr:hypothetical protein ASCRUDRAFT_83047 [Ascoidea rubescens DSM 1968]ODV58062.1 hypothetical protein ASCRUDRAFT_83047 [Ascoidea rubescens DSM 1968]